MTLLGPLLMAALIIVPVFIARMSDEVKTIAVVDEAGIFFQKFTDSENIKFNYLSADIVKAKAEFDSSGNYAVLYLPSEFVSKPSSGVLFSVKQPVISVKSYIENVLKKEIESMKLSASGIDKDILKSTETEISLNTIKLKGQGLEEKSNTDVSTILGLFGGLLIYMFIFMFGTQVLRGVIEEKTSRIVEVIISSVKPFQLMMGKITGIAFVGLTQFLLWIALTFGIITFVVPAISANTFKGGSEKSLIRESKIMSKDNAAQQIKTEQFKNQEMREILDGMASVNYGLMIAVFLFYFLFGYLLYAALFAAVGSAVDSEADTQQFMLPITIPLIFAIVMNQFVLNNPEGTVAFWLSVIPLTSPVIMMIRIPFGVPVTDVIISMLVLVAGFLFCTWFAAKIYKTGILMYGKKVNYKELWKWFTYKS